MKHLFIIISLILTASCTKKSLEEPHAHGVSTYVTVTNQFGQLSPRSVTLLFFPKNGGQSVTRTIQGTSGMVSIEPGTYDVLIYTSDFYAIDAILYRGMGDFTTAEAFTRQSSRAPLVKMVTPDPLYSLFVEDYVLRVGDNDMAVELEPRSFRYTLTVDVEGLEYVNSCSFSIQGMLTSVFLRDGHNPLDLDGQMSVELSLNEAQKSIFGEFYAFGVHPDNAIKNTMVLHFVNGKQTTVVLDDISEKIKLLTRGGDIVITQKLIIIPGDGGEGFVPKVEIWDETEVDIPL